MIYRVDPEIKFDYEAGSPVKGVIDSDPSACKQSLHGGSFAKKTATIFTRSAAACCGTWP